MQNPNRTRWAVIGAAVAIALGAGGLATVDAAISSVERAVFVAITPCRLVDTRSTSTVGPRTQPLGAAETHVVDARGDRGDCSIPTDAIALSLNVTAVDASAPTFLTVWPDGVDRPEASSLDHRPGQPPRPSAVTTGLSGAGRFAVFNRQGVVDVIVDVTGYYGDDTSDHDDDTSARDRDLHRRHGHRHRDRRRPARAVGRGEGPDGPDGTRLPRDLGERRRHRGGCIT